jgi:gamma-glutamyltranspeptidase/glutathione hydrolase
VTETIAPGRTLLARGRRGAVVSPHHLSAAAGLEMLRAGGHAVDAAIAANAALAVVSPNACGIGGDAFWLIWDGRGGEDGHGRQLALNGSGRSPGGADAAQLRREGLGLVPPAEMPATALDLGDFDPETDFRREASRRVDELLGGVFDSPSSGTDSVRD